MKNLPDVLFRLRCCSASPRIMRRVRAVGEVADFFRHCDPCTLDGLVKEVAIALAQPLCVNPSTPVDTASARMKEATS